MTTPTPEKTKRAPLTEDMPTNGVNPTPTSVPISERQASGKPAHESASDAGRKVLTDDQRR